MGDIYLVNPSEKRILDNAGDRLPIGLMSIGTYMQSKGHNVRLYDLNHDSEEDLLHSVTSSIETGERPTVGISIYTSSMENEALRLNSQLRAYSHTIAGGHHATHMPNRLNDFDSVVRGEGELGFEEAMNERRIVNARPARLENLPGLNYNLLDMENYGVDQSGRRTGTLITSRGCPYTCAFCGKLENIVRFEPTDRVKQQIDEFAERGFHGLYFLDDVFTLKKDRMNEITQHVKTHNLPFRVTTRANLVDENKLEALADNGCEWLSLGIESGDNGILKKSQKGMTAEDNYQAVRNAHTAGIKTKGFFIIGLPGETEQTARRTIEFSELLRTAGLKQADFYYLTPFPGTPIWNNPEQFGIEITDRNFSKYLEAGKTAKCVINTEHLKAERIEELVNEAREKWRN